MLVVESAALETVYNIFNKDTGFIFMNKSILVNRTTLCNPALSSEFVSSLFCDKKYPGPRNQL